MTAKATGARAENPVERLYDDTAEAYSVQERTPYRLQTSLKLVEPLIAAGAPDRIVDVGCGSGAMLSVIARRHPRIDCLGLDFSEKLLGIAAQNSRAPNLRFEWSDLVMATAKARREWLGGAGTKTLLLAIGPLAHYGPDTPFAAALKRLWDEVAHGSFLVTLHNGERLGLGLTRRSGKAYWNAGEALRFFPRASDEARVEYFNFQPCDALAARNALLDRVLLALDGLPERLPPAWRRAASANLALVARRA